MFGMQTNTGQQPAKKPESRFAKYMLKSDEPSWVGNDAATAPPQAKSNQSLAYKRRTIPTQLRKRATKASIESLEEDKAANPVVPFQIKKRHSKEEEEEAARANHAWNQAYGYNDRPPSKSMYDLGGPNEDTAESSLLIDNADFAELAHRPDGFANAFNRYTRHKVEETSQNDPKNEQKSRPFMSQKDVQLRDGDVVMADVSGGAAAPNHKNRHANTPSRPPESAVIIYGFGDMNFNLIVDHFAKFGHILEDFPGREEGGSGRLLSAIILSQQREKEIQGKRQKNGNNGFAKLKNYPIFMGPGWVKITYNEPSAAIRALRENDSRDDQNSVVGVAPYTRKGLEALLGRPIPDALDVGNGLGSLHFEAEEVSFPEDSLGISAVLKKSFIDSGALSAGEPGKPTGGDAFKLKDGSTLINTKKNTTKKNSAGVVKGSLKFWFGTGDI